VTTGTDIVIREEPDLSPEELWGFYVENRCCETRYDSSTATSVLKRSSVIVTAREKGRLVGVARALSDGLSAHIMELAVAVSHQGPGCEWRCGALVEDDMCRVGEALATTMVELLLAQGVDFIDVVVCGSGIGDDGETPVFKNAGFIQNTGHAVMYVDKRPPME